MASNESDQKESVINWASQEVAEQRNRGRAQVYRHCLIAYMVPDDLNMNASPREVF